MIHSSLAVKENSGFASLVLPSLALQGAFERIARIPASAYCGMSDWGDSDGGGFDDSSHRDCPADD
jgi:hypothetical protein